MPTGATTRGRRAHAVSGSFIADPDGNLRPALKFRLLTAALLPTAGQPEALTTAAAAAAFSVTPPGSLGDSARYGPDASAPRRSPKRILGAPAGPSSFATLGKATLTTGNAPAAAGSIIPALGALLPSEVTALGTASVTTETSQPPQRQLVAAVDPGSPLVGTLHASIAQVPPCIPVLTASNKQYSSSCPFHTAACLCESAPLILVCLWFQQVLPLPPPPLVSCPPNHVMIGAHPRPSPSIRSWSRGSFPSSPTCPVR